MLSFISVGGAKGDDLQSTNILSYILNKPKTTDINSSSSSSTLNLSPRYP